jgi:hypothetical protein
MRYLMTVLACIVLLPATAHVQQQKESYDYWRFQRDMIQRGQQPITSACSISSGGPALHPV